MTSILTGNAYVTIGHGPSGELTAQQIAKAASHKIVSVSENAHPSIREQARAFREKIEATLVVYLEQMAEVERSRIATMLEKSGWEELSERIRSV